MIDQDDYQPMPPQVADLLLEQAGGAEPALSLQTGTKVDTGRWFVRSRLWLCVTDSQLLLLAAARRQYAEVLDLATLQDTYYSHATGQLVLEPTEGVRYSQIYLAPIDALRVIGLIEEAGQQTKPSNDTATENSRA